MTIVKLGYHLSRMIDPGWILERRTLSRFLPDDGSGRHLDVACREGFKSTFFAERGFRVIGVDIDMPSIQKGKAVFGGSGCDFVIASADRLPFRAGSFQETSCLSSLTMFDSPAEALKEMNRTLAEDGELLLTVASVHAPWRNRRKYTIRTLEEALNDTGFQIIDDSSFVRAPILRWIERLRLSWKPGWYRLVKMPLYLLCWPFAVGEKLERGDGYIVAARARKTKS